MDKEDQNYSAGLPASFGSLDYTLDHHHQQQQQQHQQQQLIQSRFEENSGDSNAGMVDYMLSNPPPQQASPGFFNSSCLDRLNFADVMQFADFGPKLGLNQTNNISDGENGIDDQVYFLKFPVLSDKLQDNSLMIPSPATIQGGSMESMAKVAEAEEEKEEREETGGQVSENASSVRLRILAGSLQKNPSGGTPKNKRKRPRSIKTSEEVESQRMTHIAVERNRRKQMNEHLRVLRSLMPGSYVQRGDQASIIGGAIEFVRELEQLLQCLESQKRRRLYGGGDQAPRPIESPLPIAQAPQEPQFFPCMPLPNDQFKLAADFEAGIREETAENKSFLADVEVKLLGFDAMIKILSRRRPGQLLKTIAALEDLQLSILHTNITTIEQTVLYSFNVKVSNESRFTADDIANSVQQIFNFIHASTTTTNSI